MKTNFNYNNPFGSLFSIINTACRKAKGGPPDQMLSQLAQFLAKLIALQGMDSLNVGGNGFNCKDIPSNPAASRLRVSAQSQKIRIQ